PQRRCTTIAIANRSHRNDTELQAVGAVCYRDLARNAGAPPSRLQIAPTGTTRNFKLWERF
ncbi:MAG: hypothetical protein R6U40_02270, partial [Desulfobacterales bacterium]